MINSKLFWSELELITMTDNFFTCVKKTHHKSSCICAHSTVKLTRGVVHFIHRVYIPLKKNRKLKQVDKSEVNESSKSLLCMNECKIN